MKEFELIDKIREFLPRAPDSLLVEAGDDAAVIKGTLCDRVITTDTQVEGVHFSPAWSSWSDIGRRSYEVAASDAAAMGAFPSFVLAALQLSEDQRADDVLACMKGLSEAADRSGCTVAGGNIVVYQGPFTITLAVEGLLPEGRPPLRRSGALRGDLVCSTGMPGMARIGLAALQRGRRPDSEFVNACVEKCLRPHACVAEVDFLLKRAALHAACDISDGLAGDLGHVLQQSRCGVELVPEEVIPEAYKTACREFDLEPRACFFGSSDDYELLLAGVFTDFDGLSGEFARRFGRKLCRLGTITDGSGIQAVSPDGTRERIPPVSYEHG